VPTESKCVRRSIPALFVAVLLSLGVFFSPYADYSNLMSGAMMGYHDVTRGPMECFNAAAHKFLGWYSDKALTITDLNSQQGLFQVTAFVDYAVTAAGYQWNIISIGDSVHMQYNRKKKHNSGVMERGDELVIVTDAPGIRSGAWLVSSLAAPPSSNTVINSPSTGRIDICSRYDSPDDNSYPDYLLVSIQPYGSPYSLCGQVQAQSAARPSQASSSCLGNFQFCGKSGDCCSGTCSRWVCQPDAGGVEMITAQEPGASHLATPEERGAVRRR
jgi:hypothetical protein